MARKRRPAEWLPAYVATEGENRVVWSRRWLFLQTIRHLEPARIVLDDLAQRGVAAVRALYDEHAASLPPREGTSKGDPYGADAFVEWYGASCESGNEPATSLWNTLHEWQARYQLVVPPGLPDWVHDTALRTVRAWEANPQVREGVGWVMRFPTERIPTWGDLSQFKFIYPRWNFPPAWDPTLHPREPAERAIEAEFKQELAQFMNAVERRAEAQDYVRSRPKREPRHFEWLVRFQVLGESASRMARQAKVSVDAVRRANAELSRSIGLALRKGKPGRPRKPSS